MGVAIADGNVLGGGGHFGSRMWFRNGEEMGKEKATASLQSIRYESSRVVAIVMSKLLVARIRRSASDDVRRRPTPHFLIPVTNHVFFRVHTEMALCSVSPTRSSLLPQTC